MRVVQGALYVSGPWLRARLHAVPKAWCFMLTAVVHIVSPEVISTNILKEMNGQDIDYIIYFHLAYLYITKHSYLRSPSY